MKRCRLGLWGVLAALALLQPYHSIIAEGGPQAQPAIDSWLATSLAPSLLLTAVKFLGQNLTPHRYSPQNSLSILQRKRVIGNGAFTPPLHDSRDSMDVPDTEDLPSSFPPPPAARTKTRPRSVLHSRSCTSHSFRHFLIGKIRYHYY